MSGDRLVSVVVPLHNEERYVRKCLQSIQKQTYSNLEVIVVDDRSTDASLTMVNRLAYSDSRIRITRTREKEGPFAARMAGIEEARGQRIIFVDSDDLLRRRSVELLCEAMDRFDTDLVQMRFVRRFRSLNFRYGETFDASLCDRRLEGPDYQALASYIGMDSFISPSMCGKLYRTSLLRMALRPEFNQNWGEDQVANIDYLRAARSAAFIDYTGYIYRWGGSSSHFHYSDLAKYKRIHLLKIREGQDCACLDRELLMLLRYYVRQLNSELGWTRDAIVMTLRRELRDPIWQGIADAEETVAIVDREMAVTQKNTIRTIAKRLLR